MRKRIRITLLTEALLLLAISLSYGCSAGRMHHYDVVVYGGTAGGAVAAVAAANEGVSVALLEPRQHIGGMISGGLGRTDFGNKSVIGGMSREFFERVGAHYSDPIAWYFEPHVAERVLRDWLSEADVEIYFNHRLDLSGVTTSGGRIARIRMENGATFEASVFIDASYEGDLMSRAGVKYTWGREGREQYGESLAGRHERSAKHQFDVKISPYDDDGNLLPQVYEGDETPVGGADRKVQAYNFRMCLTNRKDNRVPFPKPINYNPHRYELLKRYLQVKGKDLTLDQLMILSPMPNDKTDVNNRGAFSTDHIGGSWDYPNADYLRRQEIWDDHVRYQQGFFYFLANDPSVPAHIQKAMNEWGLSADEFTDTNHWPHQLYIREARRMIGAFVMTQADLQTQRSKPDSIGMGSYNSDSHNVQRVPTADGFVENEGDMQVPVQPYEMAYRAITPKQDECGNLLVPVCFSASHVAYSSMRMEPQYMILGHTAGVAADYAVRNEVPVQEVDVSWLQRRLREQRQVLTMADAVKRDVWQLSLRGIVVDNRSAKVTGPWQPSTACEPYLGIDYLHDGNADKGTLTARFEPGLPKQGLYEVRIAYTPHPNRATNVPIRLKTTSGVKALTLNQQKRPAHPPFESLGRFNCGPDTYIEISNAGTDGHVIVDAVQWLPARKR